MYLTISLHSIYLCRKGTIVNAREAKLAPGTIVSVRQSFQPHIRRIVPDVGKVFDRFAGKPYFSHSSASLSGFADDVQGQNQRLHCCQYLPELQP